MSNTKNTIGLVVVALLAIIGWFTPAGHKVADSFVGSASIATNVNYNSLGATSISVGTGCNDSNTSSTCNGTYGNTSANELHGGVGMTFLRQAFTTASASQTANSSGLYSASSTVCSFLSPASTSTIAWIQVQPTSLATSTQLISFGTSTSANLSATSSQFVTAIALTASTSPVILVNPGTGLSDMVQPSTYVNVGVNGGISPGTLTGYCQLEFNSL